LLKEVLPAVSWSVHLERCLIAIPAKAAADFAFGVLLHDVPPATVRFVVEDLRMSGSEVQHILSLVHALPQFKTLPSAPDHVVKRFLRRERFQEHLELARICASAGDGDLGGYNFALDKTRQWPPEEITPPPLVSGRELISMGFAPGPLFKEILTRVEDEQLDGRLNTTQQALDFIASEYRK